MYGMVGYAARDPADHADWRIVSCSLEEEITDIVVKQTGREGCLHTVEIQTEIQV